MTLEAAVAHLAAMEAQRLHALELLKLAAETHEHTLAAYQEAAAARDEALDSVILMTGRDSERVVKRPATAGDDLRDLDDVGGH